MGLNGYEYRRCYGVKTGLFSFGGDVYQEYFRKHDLAAKVFASVVNTLAEHMEIDVARQRLDSTHVFSNMATFGRTRLLATAINWFRPIAQADAIMSMWNMNDINNREVLFL